MMKCVVIIFTLINLLKAQGLQPQDLYKKTVPSIITLSVLKENKEIGIGAAFLSIKEGIAVTAWHVVSGARSVNAKFSNGEEYEVSGLIDKDERRDLALIRVKAFGKPMLKIDSKEVDIGAKAYVIGTPRGLEFSISDGIISQVQSFDSFKQYQFSCPASPGNSGGPLLNSRGEVLGVVSWQVRDGQNLNFAIPCIYLLGLDASLPTQPWTSVNSTTSITSASTEKADKIIADAVTISQDLWLSCQFTYKNIVRKKNGYQVGLPYQLYSFLEESQRILSQLMILFKHAPFVNR